MIRRRERRFNLSFLCKVTRLFEHMQRLGKFYVVVSISEIPTTISILVLRTLPKYAAFLLAWGANLPG